MIEEQLEKNSRYVKYTTKKCGTTDDKYIYEIGSIYSCTTKDGDSIPENKVPSATSKCYKWSAWSAKNSCDTSLANCKKSSIMLYYWYKYKMFQDRLQTARRMQLFCPQGQQQP